MLVYTLAGKATSNIVNILGSLEYNAQGNDDIKEGLERLSILTEADILVVFDSALVQDGHLLDCEQVFVTLNEFVGVNPDMEVLYITKDKDLYELFMNCMITRNRFRCNLVKKLTPKIIDECIKNTYIEQQEETIEEQPKVEIKSVVEETQPEDIKEEEPKEEIVRPRPVKKPKKEKKEKPPKPVKQEKPKEPRGNHKEKINLNNMITKNMLFVVTGESNTGVSSTAVALANTFADNDVDTVIIDGDIYKMSLSRYFSIIDSGCDTIQKCGLKTAVDDLGMLEEVIIPIKEKLHLVGTSSEVSWKNLEDIYDEEYVLGDMLNYLGQSFKVTIITMPIDLLLKADSVIRNSDDIIYCSPCTVNGVGGIERYLATRNYKDKRLINILKIMHRKLSYVLTNVSPSTLVPGNWLTYMTDVVGEATLHRYVLGNIEHVDGYDNFDTAKMSPSDNMQIKDTYLNIIIRLLGGDN